MDREIKGERRIVEAQLSLLLNVGLLTRHSAAQERYVFAMPNAGPLVRSVIAGRKVRPLALCLSAFDLIKQPFVMCGVVNQQCKEYLRLPCIRPHRPCEARSLLHCLFSRACLGRVLCTMGGSRQAFGVLTQALERGLAV